MAFRRIGDGLRWLFRRDGVDREMDDEVRGFVEEAAREKMKRGMGREDALRQARLELGGVENVKEQVRAFGWEAVVGNLWQDLRFGARMLRKNPGFTAVAIAALALGIGADTAMYTIVVESLSWKMGLDDPDRMVVINSLDRTGSRDFFGASYPDFRDFRAQTTTLDGLAAYVMTPVNLSDDKTLPDVYQCVAMSANGFSVARLKPALGRDFLPADERPGSPPVLMIAYHVWRDRYALDPHVLGKIVRVDEIPRAVIGVMPPERRFPEDTDLWRPLVPDADLEKRDNRSLLLFGRLRDGGSLPSVRAEFVTLARRLETQYPDADKDVTADVEPIMSVTGLYLMRPLFLMLFASVGFVLLIACADVANMLLVRAATRRREIAIRVALGARRGSILRQLLVESVMLSIAGGFFGWLTALGGLRLFDRGVATIEKPSWLHLTLDRHPLLYLAAISIGTGILFGLSPALRLSKTNASDALKEGGGAVSNKRGLRASSALAGLQMALCVLLLAAAGLMIRSAVKLYGVPIGVNPSNVLTMRVNLPDAKYAKPQSWIAFYGEMEKRIAAVPGVELASVASQLPLGGWDSYQLEFEGRSDGSPAGLRSGGLAVENDYFQVMQIHALRGRLFEKSDGDSSSPVAVVNQAFAAKFWPGEDALGKRIRLISDSSTGRWLTVVGVIGDVLQNRRDSLEHDPLVYVPFAEEPQQQAFLAARTLVPPGTLGDSFREAVQQVDPNLAVYDLRTLDQRIAESRLTVDMLGALCSTFAGIATLLAGIGLYGVIAHAVRQRNREIGVRMALGASRRDIARMVFGQALPPLAAGLAIGVVAALAVGQLLRATLVGVSSKDPAALIGAVVVMLFAAFLGCLVPAQRAMRVDPIEALRHE